eukprot:CAMPEP_0175818046 /NCGR_PEP_ID=MMETSP0107_2-20121207/7337_1 /TAXON_ID=195067 ORGANISM="Goniomonas pacifica, Strain CCMP1869" /NCGR_SAMPLE_ID=MMETSP0107_2 /ASSEMBLY_ACC=CAM_ASM_000203 /LENGTH=105 /DNA_ID=CAMNT_0017130221 /DNA_START=171 /DNA_END=489 /DNA_ORIENTATION=+
MTGASGSVARMEVERTAFGNDAVTLQHVGEAEEGVCTSPHKDLVPCSGWKARSPHEHRRVLSSVLHAIDVSSSPSLCVYLPSMVMLGVDVKATPSRGASKVTASP